MMRALAVVLLFAALLATRASASDPLIRVNSQVLGSHVVDNGKPGWTVGDVTISGAAIVDRKDRRIGTSATVCRYLGRTLPGQASLCQAVYNFPLGKIICEGTRQRRDYYVLAVVGGSGRYSHASGTMLSITVQDKPVRIDRLLFSLQS